MDYRINPDDAVKIIADTSEQPGPGFNNPPGNDAEYMLRLYREKSDKEWEKESPLYNGLNW